MYICTCICVYMYMHMYTHEGISMHMFSSVWVNINVCIADRSAAPRKFYVCPSVAMNFTLSSLYYHLCISVHIYMYVKMHICICIFMYLNILRLFVWSLYYVVYMYVCMFEYMYACMYSCMHVCMYVYIFVCMHVWKYENTLLAYISLPGMISPRKGAGVGSMHLCVTHIHTQMQTYTQKYIPRNEHTHEYVHTSIYSFVGHVLPDAEAPVSSRCILATGMMTSHVQIQYWHLYRDDVQRRAGTRTRKCRIYVTCSFAWRVHSRR